MPVISHKEFETYLQDREDEPFFPVYLIYGNDLLIQGAFDTLLNALMPTPERSINYEPLDGTYENIHEVIRRVNTFSLLPGTKVIALRESKIFYARQDKDQLLQNAKKAFEDDNIKKAAGYLLNLMGIFNFSFEDMDPSSRKISLGVGNDSGTEGQWLDEIMAYCRQNDLAVPVARDDCLILQQAVEKGFPKDNHLIITTDTVDKRRGLFKALSTKGMAVDCSVPKGARRVDQIAQESILVEKMNAILAEGGKTLDRSTYLALYEMTGFDLRTFCNNLEKLINWVGDRVEITINDVESVLQRTKSDPIYELTNALADRKADSALFFLQSNLSSGIHPLQVLSAMVNQVRKLLLVKGFIKSPQGRDWQSACPYTYFQKAILPAIVEYDRNLMDLLSDWQSMLNAEPISQNTGLSKKGKKKTKSKVTTDLLIAKTPKNPYPIYLLLKKSDGFSQEKLINALEILSEVDIKLKTSSQSPKLVLEKAILNICQI
jgi:DNA polymerase III subunit delta